MITWLRSEQPAKEMDCRYSLICNNWSGFHCRKKGAALFLHTQQAAVAHQPTELSSECVVRIALLTLSSCSHFCFESVFLYTVAVSVLILSPAERSITTLFRVLVSCIHPSLFLHPFLYPSLHAALKSPAAFHEQRRSLERARVSVLSTEFPSSSMDLLCWSFAGGKRLQYV